MKDLLLYGTLGCHLCDEALAVVTPLLDGSSFTLKKVDIANSDALMGLYDERIPVLYRPDLSLELDWPFDQNIVLAFMQANE